MRGEFLPTVTTPSVCWSMKQTTKQQDCISIFFPRPFLIVSRVNISFLCVTQVFCTQQNTSVSITSPFRSGGIRTWSMIPRLNKNIFVERNWRIVDRINELMDGILQRFFSLFFSLQKVLSNPVNETSVEIRYTQFRLLLFFFFIPFFC